MILRLLFALAVLSLAACATTTIDSLTPGTPLGTTERGFMKTTTGLSLTVRGRSYDQVWAAADSAMARAVTADAGRFSETLALIADDKARGVIRAAVRNPAARMGGIRLPGAAGADLRPAPRPVDSRHIAAG